MSRILARSFVVALGVAGAVVTGAGGASACVGTQNTVGVCTADRTAFQDCVYLGKPSCTTVTVSGPTCVYGWIGPNTIYQTTTC